jgi:cation diffusion facilitator CzcD-associated flavoprotein CzcO
MDNSIAKFVPQGVLMTDGDMHELDLIVLATGFDSVSGGITSIDIKGTLGTIENKWSHGIFTQLGLSAHGFPNMFFTYGPQAPTAFATGPATAELQGDWITACLKFMRARGLTQIEAAQDAERAWRDHVIDIGNQGLFPEAKSWYFGDNIPGKPREALNYMAGMPEYRRRLWDCAGNDYLGFILS